MHKLSVYLALIALLASGCSAPNPTPPSPEATGTSLFGSTEVPATESAPIETAMGQIASGAECRNPFYPVHNGAWLMYTLSDGSRSSHTMSVGGNQTFTITVQSDNSTLAMQGQCTKDGIVLLDISGISIYLGGSGSSTLTAQNMDGMTLPYDVQVGDTWSQIINLSGGNVTGTIETSYNAIGFENITVLGGSFYALKVEQNGSLSMGGQLFNTHGFTWYAQGIGVVKSVMDGGSTSELFAYNFP